jgi:hypothetical protein
MQRFESTAQQMTVVELFTSHGCSSCPPADRWLNRLMEADGLWTEVIPLAFHVDYWDYLGWKDRFAAPEYSQRQRNYRHNGGLSSVYTPGMLVNGQEWRGWYWGRPIPEGSEAEVGKLQLELPAEGSATLRFSAGPDWRGSDMEAHLAILGSDLESHIGGGENRGRTLTESFVVLAHRSTTTTSAPDTWDLAWPRFQQSDEGRYAVVAWLSSGGDPTPLQAVGGWLRVSKPIDSR